MKFLSILLTLLLLFTIVNTPLTAFAQDTGFATEAVEAAQEEALLNNIKLTALDKEPPKSAIECFSVGENGLIAIGCSSFERKTVCILSNTGVFQHGYTFKCSGSFGVELEQNNLNIYLVRSDVMLTLSALGEVERVEKILNTTENNSYWNNYVFSKRQKVGELEYVLKNDMGAYTKLVAVDKNGEEQILYNAGSNTLLTSFVILTVVLTLTITVVIVVVRQFKKND